MKFSETESAKVYELTINDVDLEIIEPGNLTNVPTVLIIPHDDLFPIEPFEFETLQAAADFVKSLQVN